MRWNNTHQDHRIRRAAHLLIAVVLALSLQWLLFSQTAPLPVSPPRQVSPTQNSPNQPSPNQFPANQAPTSQSSAAAQPGTGQRPLLIMIDPAHGGAESGAVLNPVILEKDVTLALARRLRQQLGTRGIQSQLVRDSDGILSADQRAALANAAQPALYISIHATSQGSGMRIYTAMLPTGGDNSGPFVDWETAQSALLANSRWAQGQLVAAVQKTGFPIRSLTASLRPLNNIAVPAMALEIAPTTGDVSQLASADYQQMISAALANGIAALIPSLRAKTVSAP
jgi:N-acetylmuramoyl-L-alanine amidase